MKMLRNALAAAVAAALFAPFSVQAWDGAGHMLVDQIAWDLMTPAARAQAAELVKPLDTRFNENQPYNFITAGAWMDDMRGMGKDYKWSKLHYIDIPWTPTGTPIEMPEPPNVITGIDDAAKVLRDAKSTPAQRTEALAMLIHFVGDIHQPLHATERNKDRGGNGVLISGVPFTDLMAKQGRNLHTFWDKAFRFDSQGPAIVEVWPSPEITGRPHAPGEGVIAAEAKKIVAQFPRENLPELAKDIDATSWAKESYLEGCLHAYPAGDMGDTSMVHVLTPEFAKASRVIADRRIALAGYRLADLLNELLK